MTGENDRNKILYLLPTFTFGGAERTSLNLLKGMDRSRFRICLVTSGDIYSYFHHADIEKFIAIEDLNMDVWFNSAGRFLHDIKKVAFLLKKENPDIAMGMMHYPSSLLAFAKRLFNLDVKVIASPRGPSIEYLRHFEQKLIRKICLKWIFGFFCRHADGIVVSSQGMKEECVNSFNASPDRTRVIPNSVDFNDIKIKAQEEVDLGIPAGFQLISTSGRLEREKNISHLLKAFSMVRKNEKVKLLILGDGNERKNLERLSNELNIGDDVMFAGHQANPYKFIGKSDIFVHTCLFEGFANVIIEAMACGIPVVAVDCPYGPRDIIKHGENGFLVPVNNEGALVNTISALLQDKALRNDIANKGSERVREFSLSAMAERYTAFFCQLMDGNCYESGA